LVLQVKAKDPLVQAIRVNEICQLNLMGSIQLSMPAVQALCDNNIPICYFSVVGWCYGITTRTVHEERFLQAASVRLRGAVMVLQAAGTR
jgi:CRISPR/Cas system-associated endonuclease Cas1